MTERFHTSEDDKQAIKDALCGVAKASGEYFAVEITAIAHALIKAHAVVDERPHGPGCLMPDDAWAVKDVLRHIAIQGGRLDKEHFSDLSAVAAALLATHSFVDVFTRSGSSEEPVGSQGFARPTPSSESHRAMAEAVDREGLRFAERVAEAAWLRAEALRAVALACAGSAESPRSSPPEDSAAPVDEPVVPPPVPGASL